MPSFLRKLNQAQVTNDDDPGGIIDAMRALKSSIAWGRRFSPKGWTKAIPCLLLPLLTIAAGAQVPSRLTLLRAERQAKVERATPPQRVSIEKGLRTFEKAFGRFNRVKRGKGGFHFAGGDFPAGFGFGFGLGYTRRGLLVEGYPEPDRPNRVDIDVVAAFSTREYYEFSSEIKYLNIDGSLVNMAFRGRYLEFPEEEFFGIGSESARKDRTNYLFRSLEGGSDLWLAPIKRFRIGGGVSYLSPSVGSGRDDRFASLEEVFGPAAVSGFQERQPDYLRVDAFIDYDRRDNPLYPRAGTFLGTKFSN